MLKNRRNLILSTFSVIVMAIFVSGCGGNLINRVDNFWSLGCCGGAIVILDIIALLEIAGTDRSASNKVLWALLIIFFPVGGLLLYFFFGR